ncbi:MAG: tripartite tricarboxylate transporter substrate-binding protein [Thermodesulfobacteriota bacterium]
MDSLVNVCFHWACGRVRLLSFCFNMNIISNRSIKMKGDDMITRLKKNFVSICFFVFILSLGVGSPLFAEDAASFYKGKILNFIVGYSPGGGYDTWSRFLAPVLEKELKCRVIVRNMPGAAGLVALNYMTLSAKKDGTFLMISPVAGAQLSQMLESEGVKYDCRKFNWLIRLDYEPQVIMVAKNSPFKTVDDLRKINKLIATGPEPTARAALSTILAGNALGLDNLKMVYGYPGSAEQIVAIMRGQSHLYSPSVGTALRNMDELNPILIVSKKRDPLLPDTPSVYESKLTPDGKKMMDKLLPLYEVGRSIITTPGVPPERVALLRKVLLKSMQDKELLEKGKKLQLFADILPGDEVEKLVNDMMDLSPEELKNIKYVVFEKFQS